ncbi:uncharacterized protein LOC128299453 [Anopheles moucheti]|uniref:uncharacterized protein LOC128299453 n=1 Tax=Anopheles moucheti TaxID=186751 RepID=UPI0022F0FEF0|nr:uncharacterized protein LOC128299453 [Anopheles moucheti]
MEKKIKAAQLKKRQAHALIQNLEQFKDSYTARDSGDIPVCLEQLECHKADFMDAISKLEELDDRPEAIDGYIQERCDMDSRFRRLKGFFLQQQPTEANPLNASLLYANASALSTSHTGSINLRLPKIELPTFDGDSTKWLTFRDRFVAMIDSSVDIPSIMKLQYLLSSLKGDAGLLFEHTTLTADNYAVTWNSLLKRYDNPRMLTREYYRKIHYLPAVQSENVDELAQLVDEFTRHVNGLRKLNEPIETWDTPLTNMLFLKLDSSTILAWEKFSAHHEKDKYKQLIDFLQDRVRILRSTRTYAQETELHSRKMTGSEQKMRLKAGVNAATARRPQPNPATVPSSSCPLGCAEMHNLRTCPEFAKKELHQRRQIIVSERLCWNCLNRGHQVKSCSSSHRCNTCNARHHSMLHDHLHPKAILSVHADVDAVCLETVVLNLVDDHGFRYEARALLDSGSMCNLISDSLARRMLSTQSKVNVTVSGIGQASQQIKGCIVATVESKSQQFSSQLEFLVLKNPVMDIPTEPIDVTAWKFPTDNLADEAFNIPAKIDVVIGSEAYWEMHTGRKLSLGKGKPWLVETPFGWAVAGNTSLVSTSIQRSCHTTTIQATLDGMLQRFWETESIMEGPAMSLEENMCEKHYVATTHRNAQGRYVVSLPQNLSSSRVLGLSRAIADRRLLGVERRLKSNPEMDIEYKRFMREYEELGHMRKLTEPVDDSITHCYIPHHAVLKESSTSTKVRVVFDASCKTTSGYSLNDTLLVGPIVQEDLLSIILRFRSHAIAIVADVEKMYRQILHSDQDRNLLRIRYRESQVDPIATYELTTVTYGTASAPFLATRTLQQIAHDHKDKFPKAVNPVLHDFYVDDLLTGATDINEAIAVRKQISAMLNSAGFTLKKWASNVPESLRDVPQEDLAIQSLHEWKDGQAVSTLGLVWEPGNDMFCFKVDLPSPAEVLTRSLVLSYTASIFDPIGLLGPTIILAKVFLQRLWCLRHDGKAYDWDRALPNDLQEEWRKFHSTLYLLRKLRVPRFVAQPKTVNLQLHVFADASQTAYGACCYVRAESMHTTSVKLLAAKSKVVSLANTHSIAKLELCAARLAIQLYQKVSRALTTSTIAVCWTDSMTVLYWLNSPPRRWNPFVANRVAQIQEEIRVAEWRHVPGSDNPADDISRGLKPEELLECNRWWRGPQWLAYGQDKWPKSAPIPKKHDGDIEERVAASRIVTVSTKCEFRGTFFKRFSVYNRMRRVMAYCLRFIDCLRNASMVRCKKQTIIGKLENTIPPLTALELRRAELKLCFLAQQDSFADEITYLKKEKQISSSSKLKWLSPYLDHTGMLRIGGRLGNAELPEEGKHPIMLSSKHPLSVLLAVAYHVKLLHAGPQLLLATLRQRFWMIGGRNLSKAVFHRCQVCFKNKPTLIKQAIADLPTSRVSPNRPFSISGVDYCGPFMIKSTVRNRSPTKAYIAIFVCFATRAVHIELVSDLTTTAFLAALRRFVARRGKVCELHSDNATTFKGAANELRRLYEMLKTNDEDRRSIVDWCANNEMDWKFIPPRAPHFGGLWEAAVKSAKKHMMKIIGTTSITQENMLTLLAQVEQCLNSRPLISLSDEPSDTEALTPGHFLVGSNMQAVPEVDMRHIPSNRLKEYQLVQKQVQQIWSRWYPEYLQQLQARAKHYNNAPVELEINQLAIIKEDNLHPTVWPLGRITALHPGKDGITRVVTLRTAGGKAITRAANRLALLPRPIRLDR